VSNASIQLSRRVQVIQCSAAVISCVVSIIGFPLVLNQFKQMRSTAAGQAHSWTFEYLDRIHGDFLEKPQLTPFFYSRKVVSQSDGEDVRRRVDIMCERILCVLEHAVLQKDNMPSDGGQNCWREFALIRFERSIELRRFFAMNRRIFSAEFCRFVDALPIDTTSDWAEPVLGDDRRVVAHGTD
jgi:hypothetical protein